MKKLEQGNNSGKEILRQSKKNIELYFTPPVGRNKRHLLGN